MTELIYVLVMTHITIACVTLYLHRSQAHRAVEFHPVVAHAMRFWLWLTTGMVTKQWVAIHRKHHVHSDNPGDPHSPHVFGIWRVFTQGAVLYHTASKDTAMVAQYGVGTPDDWIERTVYSKHSRLGILIMLLINLWLFGGIGFILWGIQMLWIPFWAAGVINGLAHWWGYRNGQTRDRSRNILPFGIIIGGEELHNNHHLNAGSAKLSLKPWEFDIGWMYITLLGYVGLAKLRPK
jgi:stearoyl-CoA desaturase (delta-9 desaturase)